MKTTIVALVAFLAAFVAASPVEDHHHDFALGAGALMERAQGKKKPSKHNHKAQDLRKPCNCPPANCPAGLITDKKSVGCLYRCGSAWSRPRPLTSAAALPVPEQQLGEVLPPVQRRLPCSVQEGKSSRAPAVVLFSQQCRLARRNALPPAPACWRSGTCSPLSPRPGGRLSGPRHTRVQLTGGNSSRHLKVEPAREKWEGQSGNGPVI